MQNRAPMHCNCGEEKACESDELGRSASWVWEGSRVR